LEQNFDHEHLFIFVFYWQSYLSRFWGHHLAISKQTIPIDCLILGTCLPITSSCVCHHDTLNNSSSLWCTPTSFCHCTNCLLFSCSSAVSCFPISFQTIGCCTRNEHNWQICTWTTVRRGCWLGKYRRKPLQGWSELQIIMG